MVVDAPKNSPNKEIANIPLGSESNIDKNELKMDFECNTEKQEETFEKHLSFLCPKNFTLLTPSANF